MWFKKPNRVSEKQIVEALCLDPSTVRDALARESIKPKSDNRFDHRTAERLRLAMVERIRNAAMPQRI
jgi:hypothetical protein